MSQLTIKEKINEISSSYTFDHDLKLQFENCPIIVKSNSKELIEKLKNYYYGFIGNSNDPIITVHAIESDEIDLGLKYTIKEREPGKTNLKEEFLDCTDGRIVRKIRTGMIFLFGREHNLAVGPCIENDNQIVNFINNRFIEWILHQDCILGHAAAVTHNGRGISIAGFSGAGKSSLALKIMNLGTTFLSNDRVMVQKDANGLKMFGVPKHPRVNPGTVLNNSKLECVIPKDKQEEFQNLPIEELWDLEYKYDAFVHDCYGENKFILEHKMDALVILNWKRTSEEPMEVKTVDLKNRRELLPAFMKSTGLFYEDQPGAPQPDFSEEAYIDYLQHCTIIEITGKIDFEKAAEYCYNYLETGQV